jgi:hypothetical protein
MKESTAIVSQPTGSTDIGNPSAFLFDLGRMQALMSFAEMMSKAVVTVPKHLQGKPADCMAITLQAMRWQMDPFIVASKTHVVNGNLGYEAQLVVAVLKNSGAVKGRPHYEFQGDGAGLQCRAGFIPAGESDVVWTEWLAISKITTKNSPLWKTNEKQQMGYVQARNWARLYAPDALLGIYTDDELDAQPAERYMGPVDEVAQPAKPALPHYDGDKFDANLPAWAKLVADGKKTASDLFAMLSTKATFSEEQKASILSLKIRPPVDVPPDQPAAPAETADATDTWVEDYDAAGGAK